MSEGRYQNPEKKVDESWKDQVEKEKVSPESVETRPPVDFTIFLSSLGLEAYVALGEIEHPVTRVKKMNLDHAQYLIDVIELLRHKTKGNLTQEEGNTVSQLLYELRMKYVAKKGAS